jgi:hypothetical protein
MSEQNTSVEVKDAEPVNGSGKKFEVGFGCAQRGGLLWEGN